MKKKICIINIIFTLILVVYLHSAFADGKVFTGRDFSLMRSLEQNQQLAAISYKDGRERLVIAINFELEEADKALWIFPVPGKPKTTNIDVLDSFPNFYGRDLLVSARSNLNSLMTIVRATQIYPLFFEGVFFSTLGRYKQGISVHRQVEKWGIRTEVVTVESLVSLAKYLQERNTALNKQELSAFEPYLSTSYALIVSWISSVEEFKEKFIENNTGSRVFDRWPCLFVEFDTDRAFYPLKPTGTYGDTAIPVTLYVVGYNIPLCDGNLEKMLTVKYYRQTKSVEDNKFFDNISSRDIQYSRISIDTAARNFTSDLWFTSTKLPMQIKYAEFIEKIFTNKLTGFILFLFISAILSYISAGVTALLFGRKWTGFAELGLWNLLTLVGLAFAVWHVKEQEKKEVLHKGSRIIKPWLLVIAGAILLVLAFINLFAAVVSLIITAVIFGVLAILQKSLFLLYFTIIYVFFTVLTQIVFLLPLH